MEEFRKSKLEGVFDHERAGKRMKLPTPETWETQVSMKGNKKETWESLLGMNLYFSMKIFIMYKHCHNNYQYITG